MDALGHDELGPARAFYRSVEDPTAKAVLDFLIDHPDQRFDGAAIAGALGLLQHREVARATYRLGLLLSAAGRARLWQESQLGYLIPEAAAEVLRRARALGGVAGRL